MPNRNALEGAVRYAEKQRHRNLAMKIVEMIQEDDDNGREESEDEHNSDTELQDLMVQKGADRARQLMREQIADVEESNTMISLTKFEQFSTRSGSSTNQKEVTLDFTSISKKVSKEKNALPRDDDTLSKDDEQEVLRPVAVNNVKSGKNPFASKMKNKPISSRNTKRFHEDSEEEHESIIADSNESNDAANGDIHDEDSIAFTNFFEENRVTIYENYSNNENEQEIGSEQELIKVARAQFDSLSKAEKKKWRNNKKSAKPSKKAKASSSSANGDNHEASSNKITNFFRKH